MSFDDRKSFVVTADVRRLRILRKLRRNQSLTSAATSGTGGESARLDLSIILTTCVALCFR